MKNIKVIALTMLTFVTIASMVFVSCQKKETLANSSATTKKSHTRYMLYPKEITIVRGIDLTLNGVSFHCIAGGPICEFSISFLNSSKEMRFHTEAPRDATECFGGIAKDENGKLVIFFQKSSMSSDFTEFFIDGKMKMPQNRTIPKSQLLGAEFYEDYEISAGQYNYIDDGNYYIVTI